MHRAPGLRILFPTDFSAACLQAGRALTRLADGCRLERTVAHVVKPGSDVGRARRALESFVAQIDGGVDTARILLEREQPADAIADLCRQKRFDLVMAPASDRTGVPRLFRPSFRAQLLRRCAVPLWTAGGLATSERPLHTVACLVDFDDAPAGFLHLARAFADRVGARLRVLSVVPRVDEGTLGDVLTSDAPLRPEFAVSRIQALLGGRRGATEIDVAVGGQARGLRRLLARGPADVLLVGRRRAANGAWLSGFAHDLDRLRCPVVCVDGAAARSPGWSFVGVSDVAQPASVEDRRLVGAGHAV